MRMLRHTSGPVDHLDIVVVEVNDKAPHAILRVVCTVPWCTVVGPSRGHRQLVKLADSCLAWGRDGKVDAPWLRFCACEQAPLSG